MIVGIAVGASIGGVALIIIVVIIIVVQYKKERQRQIAVKMHKQGVRI